jgi:hypothetical protein
MHIVKTFALTFFYESGNVVSVKRTVDFVMYFQSLFTAAAAERKRTFISRQTFCHDNILFTVSLFFLTQLKCVPLKQLKAHIFKLKSR